MRPAVAPGAERWISRLVFVASVGLVGILVARGHGFTTVAFEHGVLALLAALTWHLAALGAGSAILGRIAPHVLEEDTALVHALLVGLGVWGLLGLLMGALGAFSGVGIGLCAALLASGWLLRPRLTLPRFPSWMWLVLLAAAVPGAIDALAPPTDTDEVYYHLAVPRFVLEHGGLVGGPFHPDGSRPLTLHLPFAMLLRTGGDSAVRLFHLGYGLVLLAFVYLLVRERGRAAAGVALIVLLGSWSFTSELGLASTNLPVALAALAVVDRALRRDVRTLALVAGVALSIKYNAVGVVAGALLLAKIPLRQRIGAGAVALLFLVPWWIRNAAEGLHPLFPFAGWDGPADFRFQYAEKYGEGRDLGALLRLPWNVTMHGSPDRFQFLGQIHPAFLVLAPLGLGLAIFRGGDTRRLAGIAIVALVFWAMGPHWIRYLIPTLPLLALLGAQCVGGHRWATGAVFVLLAMGVPSNLARLATHTADALPVVLGTEPRARYLDRKLDDWTAIAWSNRHLPPDAKVALLFNWSAYLLERDSILASVEDHTPLRHFLLVHGDQSLAELRRLGVTHVIVSRVNFLHSVYDFLDEATFQRDFEAPEQLVDDRLLQEAQLLFQDGRTRVYAL